MTGERAARIAVGGLHIECSTYNPLRSRIADFQLLEGADLLDSDHFDALRGYQAAFVPTLYAHALPGGPIASETYCLIKTKLLAALSRAGPLDGVYLMMHGAAYVEGMEDAEGDLLGAVRATVGAQVPISVSYDLHGNLSDRVMSAIDMFAAYRTAPHVDVAETHRRALDQLVRCLETGTRPSLCWCPIPVVLPGERTSTEDEPARRLYAGLAAINAADGIWDASLMVGYVWADEPRITAATVLTGTDRPAMQAAAAQLARDYWDARDRFTFGSATGSIDACLDAALRPGDLPFVLADSGDNPTGGGVGDRVDVLRAVLGRTAANVIVAGIADEPATALAFQIGEGGSSQFAIGGTLDPETTDPVTLVAEVVTLAPGRSEADRQAVLRSGGITIVVTARRRPFHHLSDFHCLGLRPDRADLVVVKSGYLVPEIRALAKRTMMALSPGVVDQDIVRQPRHRSGRGVFPFDAPASFAAEVRWTEAP